MTLESTVHVIANQRARIIKLDAAGQFSRLEDFGIINSGLQQAAQTTHVQCDCCILIEFFEERNA